MIFMEDIFLSKIAPPIKINRLVIDLISQIQML